MLNNPDSTYQVNSDYLDNFPVYIRFEPKNFDDQWLINKVVVTVPLTGSTVTYMTQPGSLELGERCGKWVYLRKIVNRIPKSQSRRIPVRKSKKTKTR
jgi:hypothetical protein